MNLFTKENKVISIVRESIYLLPVLNRFDIRPGLHDATIQEICVEKNINVDFFLAIINTYAHQHYFPKTKLLSFSPLLIINYLRKTHEYYAQYVVPSIDASLAELLQSSKHEKSDIHLIQSFYSKYIQEFLKHNEVEEKTVFPYIISIFENPALADGRLAHKTFEKEHKQIEDKLHDLKNLLLKYMDTDYDENLYNDFLFRLFLFEKDTKDHARIEDVILFPIARALEKNTRI